jgi:hypothetical protein
MPSVNRLNIHPAKVLATLSAQDNSAALSCDGL